MPTLKSLQTSSIAKRWKWHLQLTTMNNNRKPRIMPIDAPQSLKTPFPSWGFILAVILFTIFATIIYATCFAYTNDQIADAIYLAEGGAKTSHPYGILAHYKNTTPRQACINTINHARFDWNGEGDFISFLGHRYCPIGASNDPRGLNKNWVKNVNYFLGRVK